MQRLHKLILVHTYRIGSPIRCEDASYNEIDELLEDVIEWFDYMPHIS